MRPRSFDYIAPAEIGDVVEVLGRTAGSVVLAGGQSLVPRLNSRRVGPDLVVDINQVQELAQVEVSAGQMSLGSLTRHRWFEVRGGSLGVPEVVVEAAASVGDQGVRHRGTLGGTVAQRDPGAQIPAALALMDAGVVIHGSRGVRQVPLRELCGDPAQRLKADELITAVHLPVTGQSQGSAYVALPALRHGRNVGAGAVIALDASGRCTTARAVLAGAATPLVLDLDGLVGRVRPPERSEADLSLMARRAEHELEDGLVRLTCSCVDTALRTAWKRAERGVSP